MEPGDEIHLVCAADAAYALPLAVMLRSVVAALAPGRRLVAHVIDDGLRAADRARVVESARGRDVRLDWIPAADVGELPECGRLSRTAWQRLMIGEVLPADLARAVWLDCDVVVETDLGRLWDEPLGDARLLAVQDSFVPRLASPMGLPRAARGGLSGDAGYFNSGVMVIDLPGWRTAAVAERVTAYVRGRRGPIPFADQECLNALFHGAWRPLDPRWNVDARAAGRSPLRARHLDRAHARAVRADPWILHFCGRLKPWTLPDDGDPATARFFTHLDCTPWSGWRPPRGARGRLVRAYGRSPLRRLVYPAEQWLFRAEARLAHAAARRRGDEGSAARGRERGRSR